MGTTTTSLLRLLVVTGPILSPYASLHNYCSHLKQRLNPRIGRIIPTSSFASPSSYAITDAYIRRSDKTLLKKLRKI